MRRRGTKRNLGVPDTTTKNQQNKRGRTGGGLGRPSTCLCSIPIGSRRYGRRKLLRHRTSGRGSSSQQPSICDLQVTGEDLEGGGTSSEDGEKKRLGGMVAGNSGANGEREREGRREESRTERGSGGGDGMLVDGKG